MIPGVTLIDRAERRRTTINRGLLAMRYIDYRLLLLCWLYLRNSGLGFGGPFCLPTPEEDSTQSEQRDNPNANSDTGNCSRTKSTFRTGKFWFGRRRTSHFNYHVGNCNNAAPVGAAAVSCSADALVRRSAYLGNSSGCVTDVCETLTEGLESFSNWPAGTHQYVFKELRMANLPE